MSKSGIFRIGGVAALLLGKSFAANAEVSFNVGASTSYDDNVYKMEKSKASTWITKVNPGVEWAVDAGSVAYSVAADAETATYSDTTIGSDRYTDFSVSGTAGLKLDSRNQLDFGAEVVSGHDNRGEGRTDVGGVTDAGSAAGVINDPDEWMREKVSGKYTFGAKDAAARVVVSASLEDKEYKNHGDNPVIAGSGDGTDNLNGKTGELKATGYMKVMPKTSVLVEYRGRRVDYDQTAHLVGSGFNGKSRDNTETKYFVGAEWNATAQTTGSVRLGRQDHSPDSSYFSDFNSTVWEAFVSWRPVKSTTVSLKTNRDISDSATALTYTDNKKYSFSAAQVWSDVSKSELTVDKVDADFDGITREDETKAYQFKHTYSVESWIDVNGSFRHENRSSNGVNLDYSRNIYMVGVEAKFK